MVQCCAYCVLLFLYNNINNKRVWLQDARTFPLLALVSLAVASSEPVRRRFPSPLAAIQVMHEVCAKCPAAGWVGGGEGEGEGGGGGEGEGDATKDGLNKDHIYNSDTDTHITSPSHTHTRAHAHTHTHNCPYLIPQGEHGLLSDPKTAQLHLHTQRLLTSLWAKRSDFFFT